MSSEPQSTPAQSTAASWGNLTQQTSPEALAALVEQARAAQETVKVVFYCKDCEKIVVGIKVGNKYVYKCPVCHTKNVAFGTEKSIRSFYYVKD